MPGTLGRQISHSDNVDVRRIRARFSPCREYRYLLKVPYKTPSGEECRRHEVISVILKNPSSADVGSTDQTVRRVEEYIYRNFCRCRELRILNLFAYRATYPRDLRTQIRRAGCINAVGPKNDQVIRSSLRSSTRIIISWGSPGLIGKICYDSRINQITQLLQPYIEILRRVVPPGRNEHSNYPRHGLTWGYNYNLILYNLEAAQADRNRRRIPEC